jgi:hypothetical protein
MRFGSAVKHSKDFKRIRGSMILETAWKTGRKSIATKFFHCLEVCGNVLTLSQIHLSLLGHQMKNFSSVNKHQLDIFEACFPIFFFLSTTQTGFFKP